MQSMLDQQIRKHFYGQILLEYIEMTGPVENVVELQSEMGFDDEEMGMALDWLLEYDMIDMTYHMPMRFRRL